MKHHCSHWQEVWWSFWAAVLHVKMVKISVYSCCERGLFSSDDLSLWNQEGFCGVVRVTTSSSETLRLEINQLGRHGSQKGQLQNNTMADVHLPSFVYSLCIVTCRLMRSEVAAECSGAAANESRHNMWSFISSFRPVSPDGSPEGEWIIHYSLRTRSLPQV